CCSYVFQGGEGPTAGGGRYQVLSDTGGYGWCSEQAIHGCYIREAMAELQAAAGVHACEGVGVFQKVFDDL
ncbi:hypothetical protein KI387_005305, partial [Taxus chinensis]